MTTAEKTVKSLCDEVYKMGFEQITIDLVQDTIEELLQVEEENKPSRDAVGAAAYECSILLDVMNPKLEKDIDLLKRMYKALNEWSDDIEATNVVLGLPKES